MKIHLITGMAFLTLAMGGQKPIIPLPYPSPSAAPQPPSAPHPANAYQDRFKSFAKTYGAILIAQATTFSFRNFFGGTIGMCTWGRGFNRVELSTNAWDRGSETFREMLVFHELGHCLLGRGHKNSRHSDGRLESLMNSYLFDQRIYLANRDAYLKELFTAEVRRVSTPMLLKEETHEGCRFGR